MANQNSKTKTSRIDPMFDEVFFKKIPIQRVKNNLEIKTLSKREISRMIMNADATPLLIKELESKSRKKNK